MAAIPIFEAKIHCCRAGAAAPSREVPSQRYALCGPKKLFLAQFRRKTQLERSNEAKRLQHAVCASIASKSQNCPTRRLDPQTSGHLVQPEGSPAHARWGLTSGPQGSPRRKTSIFPKLFLAHFGGCHKFFLARLEPVVMPFGPWKIPKCLENGPFWSQKLERNWCKMHFSESDPRPFVMLTQVLLARFEPVVTYFGQKKMPTCLENGLFRDKKWVQNGSNFLFSTVTLDHSGCSNKFSPF